jgi:hypothetical protein
MTDMVLDIGSLIIIPILVIAALYLFIKPKFGKFSYILAIALLIIAGLVQLCFPIWSG